MADEPSQGAEQVRAAEVIGALCLATDLGMGFPFEHGLHTTLAATRLADRLGVDAATASQVYYACLLSERGPTGRNDLALAVGARFWGPGRFAAALHAAVRSGKARRVSRTRYGPAGG